jgi:hypothetical protein
VPSVWDSGEVVDGLVQGWWRRAAGRCGNSRSTQPMPTELGTLDAIHLATALLWREGASTELVMATHDPALGTSSRAFGLRVVGV